MKFVPRAVGRLGSRIAGMTALLVLGPLACLDLRTDLLVVDAAVSESAPDERGLEPAGPTDAGTSDRAVPPLGRPDSGGGPPDAPTGGLHTLTLSILGPGRVRSASGDVDCAATCTIRGESRSLMLTAEPRSNAIFAGWAGACSGATPTCRLPIDSDKFVDAKFLNRGDPLWSVTIDPDAVSPYALATTATSLVVAGGIRKSTDLAGTPLQHRGGKFDPFLASFTREGQLEWAKSFGGPEDDAFLDVDTDSLGEIAALGFGDLSSDFGGGRLGGTPGRANVLVKYDGFAKHSWQVRTGASSALAWIEGRVVIRQYAVAGAGVLELRSNTNGGLLAEGLPWGGVSTTALLATGDDAGFVHAGWYAQPTTIGGRMLVSAGGDDALIVKYASDGKVVWVATFPGPGGDEAGRLAVDDLGDVYVSGSSEKGIVIGDRAYPDLKGAWLVKLAGADGRPIWSRTFPGAPPHIAMGLVIIGPDIVVSGTGLDFGGGGTDPSAGVLARLSRANAAPVWVIAQPQYTFAARTPRGNRLFGFSRSSIAEIVP